MKVLIEFRRALQRLFTFPIAFGLNAIVLFGRTCALVGLRCWGDSYVCFPFLCRKEADVLMLFSSGKSFKSTPAPLSTAAVTMTSCILFWCVDEGAYRCLRLFYLLPILDILRCLSVACRPRMQMGHGCASIARKQLCLARCGKTGVILPA